MEGFVLGLFCFFDTFVLFIKQLSEGDPLPRSVYPSQENPPVARGGVYSAETLIGKFLRSEQLCGPEKNSSHSCSNRSAGEPGVYPRKSRAGHFVCVRHLFFVNVCQVTTKLEE